MAEQTDCIIMDGIRYIPKALRVLSKDDKGRVDECRILYPDEWPVEVVDRDEFILAFVPERVVKA